MRHTHTTTQIEKIAGFIAVIAILLVTSACFWVTATAPSKEAVQVVSGYLRESGCEGMHAPDAMALAEEDDAPAVGGLAPAVLTGPTARENDGATLVSNPAAARLMTSVPNYLDAIDIPRRWAKKTVTISLVGDADGRSEAEAEALLMQSAAQWNQHFGGVVRLRVAKCDYPDVEVRFVPKHELPARVLARTDVAYRVVSHTIVRSTMWVGQGQKDSALYGVITHELGHAMGLQGHSPHKEDIMYAFAHKSTAITERDRNTLCLEYEVTPGQYPATDNAPVSTLAAATTAADSTSATATSGETTAALPPAQIASITPTVVATNP